jgi:hypothetical protein
MLLCFVLALSGLCTFNCFAQVTRKDPHACCHGKNKGGEHSLMVVRSQPPVVSQDLSVAAPPYLMVLFVPPAVSEVVPQRLIRPPVFRSSPYLTLRI